MINKKNLKITNQTNAIKCHRCLQLIDIFVVEKNQLPT